jgi:hypothetical protein
MKVQDELQGGIDNGKKNNQQLLSFYRQKIKPLPKWDISCSC